MPESLGNDTGTFVRHACSQACSEFSDPAAALQYLQQCAAQIQSNGNWTLSISGNQVFGGPCESKVTLSCQKTDAGVSDVDLNYANCHTGYCYQHGKTANCKLSDGGIGTMVCCVDHFVIDPPGGKCDTSCNDAKGKTCWGSPGTMTCKDGNTQKTLKCCGKGCNGNGGYGQAGEWCEQCT